MSEMNSIAQARLTINRMSKPVLVSEAPLLVPPDLGVLFVDAAVVVWEPLVVFEPVLPEVELPDVVELPEVKLP
jgi:hypothetical protein